MRISDWSSDVCSSDLQLDDLLGHKVAGRRLAAENLRARHALGLGIAADFVPQRGGVQDAQELALVFMDALDLDVEEGFAVDRHTQRAIEVVHEAGLVGVLGGVAALAEAGIVGQRRQALPLLDDRKRVVWGKSGSA